MFLWKLQPCCPSEFERVLLLPGAVVGCKEAMCSESVLEVIQLETALRCITQHPGFGPVCLQKWSLRMAGERVKTKAKQRYRQTGSEER